MELVAWAAAEGTPLDVVGDGSKQGLGRPLIADHVVELTGLSGISLYEPEELVLSAAAGTGMAEIESAVAERHQMLAFEPPDLGSLWGGKVGCGTLGGVLACNLSGSRRIKAGAARDHLLGVEAVSGRGEKFKAGGRVIKNVTGYDLCKLLAGSYGTLAAITQATIKVLPAPETTRTVVVLGLNDEAATAVMTVALGSAHEVSGAAHIPEKLTVYVPELARQGKAATVLRIEGVMASVKARTQALCKELATHGEVEELDDEGARALWTAVRDAKPLVASVLGDLWRLSVPPQAGWRVVQGLEKERKVDSFYDWGGGLTWLTVDGGADGGEADVRSALAPYGGHATLIRASETVRASVSVFQPQSPPLAALTRRVKEAFDPKRILNRGRMYADL